MAEKIAAEARTSFGKGAARKLRTAGRIPAVIYGHGTEPVHISLPAHETGLIIRRANAVFDLDLPTGPLMALVKDVQRDPVRQIIEHLDLIIVRITAAIIRRPWVALTGTGLFLVGCLFLAQNVSRDHALLDQFDADDPVYMTTRLLETKLDEAGARRAFYQLAIDEIRARHGASL